MSARAKAVKDKPRKNYPLSSEPGFTTRTAYGRASYMRDGLHFEADVEVTVAMDAKASNVSDTKIDCRFVRYDYNPDPSREKLETRHVITEYEFRADEIEMLAAALTAAVQIGKAEGVLPE